MSGREGETLGSALRSRRLGFGWCDTLGVYVRISDTIGGFRFDVADAAHLTGHKWTKAITFYAWWEREPDTWIAGLVTPVLFADGRPVEVEPCAFVLGEDGELVRLERPG